MNNTLLKSEVVSTQGLAIKAGLLTFAGFLVYFVIMLNLDLLRRAELRSLNFFILFAGIFFAFRYFNGRYKRKLEFTEGLLLGCLISAIALLPFAVFTGVYFGMADPALLADLKGNAPVMGAYITPLTAAITIVMEGMISGLIISFIFMQYFQNDKTHA